jgi:hypothetical protein
LGENAEIVTQQCRKFILNAASLKSRVNGFVVTAAEIPT